MYVLFLLMAALAAQAQAATGVRLVLGLTDKAQVKWDGSVTARGARVTSIDGWRFEDGDEATGTSWRAQTHPIRLFGARARRRRRRWPTASSSGWRMKPRRRRSR